MATVKQSIASANAKVQISICVIVLSFVVVLIGNVSLSILLWDNFVTVEHFQWVV